MQNNVNVTQKHKDRLFRFIFHDKDALLSLYNAINDSDYTDANSLQIYTMEDFVYMGMKNDLSFLIDMNMNIFEHQSTYNPNMPIRGFLYMAAALQKYIARNKLDLYSSKPIPLPIPRYYVFYNGQKEMPDESILYLTDNMPSENAVNNCIHSNILSDILRAHKAEVTNMVLTEYDEVLHIANEKEISFEEGKKVELENTKRERQRANEAQQRANEAQQQANEARQQAMILAGKLKGQSNEEIAEILQLPLETVTETLARALGLV